MSLPENGSEGLNGGGAGGDAQVDPPQDGGGVRAKQWSRRPLQPFEGARVSRIERSWKLIGDVRFDSRQNRISRHGHKLR